MHVKIKHQITDKFLESKCRHTICARSFHFVKTGVVKHLERPDVDKLKTKITKHYSMHQMATPAAVGVVSVVVETTGVSFLSAAGKGSNFI